MAPRKAAPKSQLDKLVDLLTLSRLYAALALVAAAAIVAWFWNGSRTVEVWSPHIAAEAIGALVTVALVGFILNRQRRPLVAVAGRRIAVALDALLQVLANHMERMGSGSVGTSDPKLAVRGWLRELEDELPQRSWLDYWASTMEGVEPGLSAVRDRYDQVLDAQLLAAIDDFTFTGARIARELRWIVSLDNAVARPNDRPTPTWTAQIIDLLEASFAKVLELGAAYEHALGERFEMTSDVWEAAHAHRHALRAGLPQDLADGR